MPDGDRFYRRLVGTGRGWGTVYRIACNNGDFTLLRDKALKGISDNLRRIDADSVERVITILHKSFNEERFQKLSLSSGDNYLKLERALEMSRLQGNFDLVEILKKSAQKVFLANKNSALTISTDEINEKISQTLAVEILDSRVSRVRDGIMKDQNRSFAEQIKWEQDLRREILEPSKKLVKGFTNSKIKKFRSPITRRVDRNATANILSRSLNVM